MFKTKMWESKTQNSATFQWVAWVIEHDVGTRKSRTTTQFKECNIDETFKMEKWQAVDRQEKHIYLCMWQSQHKRAKALHNQRSQTPTYPPTRTYTRSKCALSIGMKPGELYRGVRYEHSFDFSPQPFSSIHFFLEMKHQHPAKEQPYE